MNKKRLLAQPFLFLMHHTETRYMKIGIGYLKKSKV